MTDAEAVALIQSLEPVFFEAGRLAVDLQKKATSQSKHNSGVAAIDIVTNADLKVQEYVLSRLAKTALEECRLLAEEDTPSVDAFNAKSDFWLTLDPISGTFRYAAGRPLFAINVALRRGGEFYYTLVHYPVINWTMQIIGNQATATGDIPPISLPSNVADLILQPYPNQSLPDLDPILAAQLTERGYSLAWQRSITEEAGAHVLFMTSRTGGYFSDNPNAYDGFICYHFAKAKGLEIHLTVDWGKIVTIDGEYHHPGYYVVLNRPANRIDNV